eukprot:1886874-Rhodomonas_salina.1
MQKQTEESEIYAACGKLEEMGFTVRRCATYEVPTVVGTAELLRQTLGCNALLETAQETIERAAQLQASGHLRCVVAGGEATVTCLPGVSRAFVSAYGPPTPCPVLTYV